MAGETVITVVGNLTADPELRYTQNGKAVANFTVAVTERVRDRHHRAGCLLPGQPLAQLKVGGGVGQEDGPEVGAVLGDPVEVARLRAGVRGKGVVVGEGSGHGQDPSA